MGQPLLNIRGSVRIYPEFNLSKINHKWPVYLVITSIPSASVHPETQNEHSVIFDLETS